MKFQFDGYKHALGYAAVIAGPIAGGALFNSHLPHAQLCAVSTVVLCSLVAFLCGAQSKAAFVKSLETGAAAAGLKVSDAVVEDVADELEKDVKKDS